MRKQAEQAQATATMLHQRCLHAVAHSAAVCGQAVHAYAAAYNACQAATTHRQAARQDGAPSLDWFEIDGLLDGQSVVATRLVCDPALWDRAELLVNLREVFGDQADRPRYVASAVGRYVEQPWKVAAKEDRQ
jgi:hypothetical protein